MKSADNKNESQTEMVAVLIEMRVPRQRNESLGIEPAAVEMASALGVMIDTSFAPVPVHPSGTHRRIKLESTAESVHVIVRAEVPGDKLADLKAHPAVVEVWSDAKIEPFTWPVPPCDCSPGTPKGTLADVATYLGVQQIWALGIRGDGIVVGVVDGGICASGRPLAAGESPYRTIDNVTGGWPVDSWGTMGKSWGYHGNMCATDVQGMAPNVRIFDLRIASATSAGAVSNALAAFDWAINHHRINGTPHILTNSWGMYQQAWAADYATNPNHPFTRKVAEAVEEGIIVLFAAGNCGNKCPDNRCSSDTGPGRSIWGANGHPKVMTVGAVNIFEHFAGYSSQGPAALDPRKPDFCGITHFTGYFRSDSGTSAATPIVAGVTALLKQGKPSATPARIKRAFYTTAKSIGPAGWAQNIGAGIIRGKAAYENLMNVKIPSKNPQDSTVELSGGRKEVKTEEIDISGSSVHPG